MDDTESFSPEQIDLILKSEFDSVEHDQAFGYDFYYVGDYRKMPIVTIAQSDSEYDSVSNLSRDEVFRLNIQVSNTTFKSLFPNQENQTYDYTTLNTVLPHPEYAKQYWICILSPQLNRRNEIMSYFTEAHAIGQKRVKNSTSETPEN
jgi:hypothetical protein